MDNNLRTVKKDDLEDILYKIFRSYGVCIDGIDIDINSVCINITCKSDSVDEDDMRGIKKALAELFKFKIILYDPENLILLNVGNANLISVLHLFNIVD